MFESSRSHQEQHLLGCCSFCYARILWGSKRGGSEQPVPRGLANPFGHAKKRIAMYFCNALFVLMLFWFRIILAAYHLRHQCIALLPIVCEAFIIHGDNPPMMHFISNVRSSSKTLHTSISSFLWRTVSQHCCTRPALRMNTPSPAPTLV